MKIVLAEERGGQLANHRTFDREVIKVGRDPAECHVVFNQTEWPMVSRRHAEIRFEGGRYVIADTNSSFGTHVNNHRISEPTELRTGIVIQFGKGGPVMCVVSIEIGDQLKPTEFRPPASEARTMQDRLESFGLPPHAAPPSPQPSAPLRPQPFAPSSSSEPAILEIVSVMTGKLDRVPLAKEIVRLGRDADMDVKIEASAAVVSRRHAEIRRQDSVYFLHDLGSFNGTLLNDQRITNPVQLYDGDRFQLGMGGPVLRFVHPGSAHRPADAAIPHVPPHVAEAAAAAPASRSIGTHTIVLKGDALPKPPATGGAEPQLYLHVLFDGRSEITIGRLPDNAVRLDGLQISNHHARITNAGSALFIEDVGSTNGVYVNGRRISARQGIQSSDLLQIGPYIIQADLQRGVAVYDTRSKTRIDAIDITKTVKNRSGSGMIRLLDDVDLSIQPNEFIGLLGPSGAGKSTLMDSLNGMRPASSGVVLINNLDLYKHLDLLKQSIGYVPQDDIIHRELTVYRTLYYVARLRLSRDVSVQEIDGIVNEVMDVTGLAERRDVPVSQLSGGQRKRVSIAVELITKPSVIFLDEPTSGLDPATEEKIMLLFRQIAESGRTVILTTHAMENVKLFDKIVVMMRGKLVFYGSPMEALAHINAESYKDLYDKLEAPIEERLAKLGPLPPNATEQQKRALKQQREQISEQVAEEWKQRFQTTEIYRRNVVEPLTGINRQTVSAAPPRRRTSATDSIRQWATLSRRYLEVLARDKFNLLILFGQAPIIALLTYIVVDGLDTRDFPFFVLGLVSIWFGTSVSAREIIRERPVYNRERMVNLGLFPYVGSKLFVLSLIVGIQCVMLFLTMKLFDLAGLMKLPGATLPQLAVVVVGGIVGIALGLFISSIVKTSEMATSLVPLILIPQILFSGLVGVPKGVSRIVGLAMPATWAFDELKRLSDLDTLREEGSNPGGPNKGRGLYKRVEDINDQNIEKARRDVERYRKNAQQNADNFEKDMDDFVERLKRGESPEQPKAPQLGPAPKVPDPEKVGDDVSNYVEFLHPWGNLVVNPLVLLMMFGTLVLATVIALRTQDIA